MPSSGIIENRPQFLVPQFRSNLGGQTVTMAPVNGVLNFVTSASDVYLEYFRVNHQTGAAANVGAYIIADGVTYYTGVIAAANNTWYYVYYELSTLANLANSVNRTLAAADVPWYCHNVSLWTVARQAGVLTLIGAWRLKDL